MIELPGYELLKELGRGGMARVYLALHEGLDRHVAIKIMYHNLSADSSFNDRFLREARIVARLNHPNIITVYDVNSYKGHQYIAMEYLPGDSLGDKIKEGIGPGKALSILKEISKGLQFAHDKGFLHRDIKPENILFKEDGTPVITDFGVARAERSETQMTQAGTIIGTPHYMSPEQAQGAELKSASDIYSLGIVFYEMLTGVVPYRADSIVAIMYKHVNDPIPELTGQLKMFQPLLNKLLAKKVPDRYQNAGEIIKDIERVEIRIAPDLGTRIMPKAQLNDDTIQETVKADFTPVRKFSLKNPRMKQYAIALSAFAFVSIASIILVVSISGNDEQIADREAERKTERLAKLERKQEMERIRQEILKQEKEAKARLAAQKEEARQRELTELKEKEEERRRIARQKEKEEQQRHAAEKRKQEEQKRQAAVKRKQEQQRLAAEKKRREQSTDTSRQEQLALQMRNKKAKEQQLREKVSSLLAQARSELERDQLKEAYDSYKGVLKISSRNKKARKGLGQVAGRYLDLAEMEARNKNYQKSDVYLENAATIHPKHPQLASTRQKIQTIKDGHKKASEAATQNQRVFGGF